jgi:hypothetical protein
MCIVQNTWEYVLYIRSAWAGEAVGNHDFQLRVVDVLTFSVTVYEAYCHAYSEKSAHRARDLPRWQEVHTAPSAAVMARPAVTSSSVLDCLAAVIGSFTLPFVGGLSS